MDGFAFDYNSLLACAWGAPSAAFGPMYARFDGARRAARLLGPPYHFMSRVTKIDGPIGEWRNDLRAALANGSGIAIDDIIPRWDSVLRDKADEVQAESERLNRAMRQLRGGS